MDRKAKILFILHLPPPVHGAAMMGKYLKENQIINENFDCDFINLSTSESIDKVGKGGLEKLVLFFKIVTSVLNSLSKNKYALCYMTLTAKGIGFYKDFLIVLILKLFGKKIIYHFHNKGVEESRRNKLNSIMYRMVFKNTKSILLSPSLYRDINHYVDRSNVYFCANGIPEELVGNEFVKDNNSIVKLLFLSNMIAEKGVYDLMEACKLLNAKSISFECHFVGDFSEISKNEFEEIIVESGLNQKVFFHGKRFGNEKFEFYKKSDIFVFPTYYHNECFPLVLLEAMQFELPVISTFEGGIPDIVDDGHTGFLVPQRNVQLLADKLMTLIDNRDLRRSMGKEGRKRYNELFTLQKFEQNISEILKQAIAND